MTKKQLKNHALYRVAKNTIKKHGIMGYKSLTAITIVKAMESGQLDLLEDFYFHVKILKPLYGLESGTIFRAYILTWKVFAIDGFAIRTLNNSDTFYVDNLFNIEDFIIL